MHKDMRHLNNYLSTRAQKFTFHAHESCIAYRTVPGNVSQITSADRGYLSFDALYYHIVRFIEYGCGYGHDTLFFVGELKCKLVDMTWWNDNYRNNFDCYIADDFFLFEEHRRADHVVCRYCGGYTESRYGDDKKSDLDIILLMHIKPCKKKRSLSVTFTHILAVIHLRAFTELRMECILRRYFTQIVK